MRILALFIFLITTAEASDLPNIKNIVIHKVPKTYENVFFLNKKNEKIKINDFKGKLLVLNFWATWCPPCKEEMPSLDNIQANSSLNNLKVFPINITTLLKFLKLCPIGFDNFLIRPTPPITGVG